jgi:signal transduction histidine kinase
VAYKSITRRWIANSLGVVLLVLIFIEIGAGFGVRNYYYSSAEDALTYNADAADREMNRNKDTSKTVFRNFVRNYVETFDYKDRMEMMLIDYQGQVVTTSSGFPFEQHGVLPDYERAMNNMDGDGIGKYVGIGENGEKIMALTMRIPTLNSGYSAVRYVVSLENIDRAIFWFMLILSGLLLMVLGLILISSSYFIRSIVFPVRELGAVAREFATGDMSARIIKKSDDEIGELCDIINYMADEIQASEKMKNEFISSVSHELRTPLTAIKGWGETLMTLGAEDTVMLKKGMHVIINETERLSNMVEELLDFSRMQNGRFTLVKTKMDILAELGDAVLIYTERARRDNITLIYNEPENVSYVFGDKSRLKQVFINIIDNALKYSDSGDTVTVSVEEKEEFIWVTVSDTGIGIAPEDLPKVKEKFYKANSTRRGSGIGLAVATEIVQLHDGELTVDSQLNVGTTVTIKLPVMPKDDERKTEITINDVKEERSTDSAEKQ